MTRFALSLVAVCGLAYLGIVALVWANQRRLLYFPDRTLGGTPAHAGWAYEEVWLRAADGPRLHAFWIPAPEARGTVIFFHGNAGNIGGWYPVAAAFRALGFHTLLPDYRGYGRSEGEPSERGLYADAEAAWQHATRERGVPPERVVLAGRSLGGAVAAYLAEQHPDAGALVLESTFTSVPELAAGLYPWLPVRWMARDRFPTLARSSRLRVPVLVVHSRGDELIPFGHGEQLFRAAPEPKRLLELRGDHNGGFDLSEREYRLGLHHFLAEIGVR